MKIAIIGAMKEEIEFLLNKVQSYKQVNYLKYNFYETILFQNEIIITSSGIGKVASGMLVASLVNYYKEINLIINVGVSGGIKHNINIGEIVIANNLRYADVDVTCFTNYQYGTMPNCPSSFPTAYKLIEKLDFNMNYKLGTIISGDQFYHNENNVNYLIDTYFRNDNVLCIDMESTALAHACWFFEIDYLAIRSISDLIGSNLQIKEYNENLDFAAKNSNLFLLELLEKIS